MTTTLIISEEKLREFTDINDNLDSKLLMNAVREAQDIYLQRLTGTSLYEYILAQIDANTLSGEYKTLVDEYIIDTLVHYAMVEALPFLAYSIGNTGITKNLNSEQGASPAKNEIDYLLQKELATAQFYSERLVTYLIAQNTLYPQYLQTTGFSDNVYPDKGQQYRNGWVI